MKNKFIFWVTVLFLNLFISFSAINMWFDLFNIKYDKNIFVITHLFISFIFTNFFAITTTWVIQGVIQTLKKTISFINQIHYEVFIKDDEIKIPTLTDEEKLQIALDEEDYETALILQLKISEKGNIYNKKNNEKN